MVATKVSTPYVIFALKCDQMMTYYGHCCIDLSINPLKTI